MNPRNMTKDKAIASIRGLFSAAVFFFLAMAAIALSLSDSSYRIPAPPRPASTIGTLILIEGYIFFEFLRLTRALKRRMEQD